MVHIPFAFLAFLLVLPSVKKCMEENPDPEYQYSEYQNPEYQNPEYQNPEYQNPEYQNPEYQNPDYHQNPEYQYQYPEYPYQENQYPEYQYLEYQDPVFNLSKQKDGPEGISYLQILTDVFKIQTHRPIKPAPPTTVPDEEVHFFLFTKDNPTIPTKLTGDNLYLLDPTKTTKYFVHGWLGSSSNQWYRPSREAYFLKGDHQIICVDWGKYSRVGYAVAAQNAKSTGGVIARQILKTGLPLSTIHLIGHSLGAHASGFAGKMVQQLTNGQKIGRISGLDPAGSLFIGTDFDEHLNGNDAAFVDCIHTYTTVSYAAADCSADFYPNGGKSQPGCPFQPIGNAGDVSERIIPVLFCSHSRAYVYFIESINSENFIATKCDSYKSFISNACSDNQKVVMGENLSETARSSYYLKTNWKPTFAIGS